MNISVLLPTRKRLGHLAESVGSLSRYAADPSSVELLLYTDDDDLRAMETCDSVWAHRVIELHGPRDGYDQMHLCYNRLAAKATGKLLFIWNDDTRMLTQDWDRLLMDQAERPLIQFIRRDINPANDYTFPTVDRRIFEVMGHLSLHCYVDSWLQRVSVDAGVDQFRPDIVFHHLRLQDEVQDDNSRAVNGPNGHAKFFTMDAERAEDVRKIQEMINQRSPT